MIKQALMTSAIVFSMTASVKSETYAQLVNSAALAPNIQTGSLTRAPIGWVQFCDETPWECRAVDEKKSAELSRVSFAQLDRVNRDINKRIEAVTDADHYGIAEKWTYPNDGRGDCEDFALLKRRTLIEKGWPSSSLLITVVRDHKNEGHAVLMVVTDKGDVVLDNATDEILAWNDTGYKFVKRQAAHDPNSWVALAPSTGAEQTAVAQK